MATPRHHHCQPLVLVAHSYTGNALRNPCAEVHALCGGLPATSRPEHAIRHPERLALRQSTPTCQRSSIAIHHALLHVPHAIRQVWPTFTRTFFRLAALFSARALSHQSVQYNFVLKQPANCPTAYDNKNLVGGVSFPTKPFTAAPH